GVFDGGGADNDVRQADVEITLDGIEVADAAADLDGDFTVDFFENGLDGHLVLGRAGHGAVQVDQVQAPRALLEPLCGHRGWRFGEDGGVAQVALAQPHALAVFEVDSGNQKHDRSSLSN